ncbi:hypothetical protein ACH4PU_26410 [Streptomyces sp. NPDC021100]
MPVAAPDRPRAAASDAQMADARMADARPGGGTRPARRMPAATA